MSINFLAGDLSDNFQSQVINVTPSGGAVDGVSKYNPVAKVLGAELAQESQDVQAQLKLAVQQLENPTTDSTATTSFKLPTAEA